MNWRINSVVALLACVLCLAAVNTQAACDPVGTWIGTLNSDTQPGGVLTNWAFAPAGKTSGEWTMFTLDAATATSTDATGDWICFSGQVLATYTGTAVKSTGGSQSTYTLQFSGTTTGDTASGSYMITFNNPLWDPDTGTWDLARDADTVSDHVFYIEITAGLDHEDPFIAEDLTYEINFALSTDALVTGVEFLDPAGTTHRIPMLPDQWDNINKVWSDHYYDLVDDSYWWEYEKELSAQADLLDYDGQYTITVTYFDGSRQQTTAWFGIPGTSDPLPQPTQQPTLTNPLHNTRVSSPVQISWQQCTEPAAYFIFLILQDETSDTDEDYPFDKTATGFDTPLDLTDGPWEVALAFVAGDSGVNEDGIETFLGKYSESDYEFMVATRSNISGTVTDRDTGLPMNNMRVGLHHEDLWQWFETRTMPDGYYLLSDIPDGEVQVQVLPEPDSGYARTGQRLDLSDDVSGLDFRVVPGSTYSGKIIDAQTADPIEGLRLWYWNDAQITWQESWTDARGRFTLTNLPAGLANLNMDPPIQTGYAAYLQWESSRIDLQEGTDYPNRVIGLQKGTFTYGYVFYPDGSRAQGIGLDYEGRTIGGDTETDVNGYYQMNLPPGTYMIVPNNDELGALHTEVTVTGSEIFLAVPNITVYPVDQGGRISGTVNKPGSLPIQGMFVVVAFEPGTVFTPEKWYTIRPVIVTGRPDAGPFTLGGLPPGSNYDITLVAIDETDDEIESGTILDTVFNVAVGTTDVSLSYTTQGQTIHGQVKNIRQTPVLGAQILLADSQTGDLTCFADTDANGEYTLYNVPAGTYTITAMHAKYQDMSSSVEVTADSPVQADTILLPFAGIKEGPDLNGDGTIGLPDVAILVDQWLRPGSTANFDQIGLVDLADFSKLLESWAGETIWSH